MAVQASDDRTEAAEADYCTSIVSSLLESQFDACGSVVVQCESVLAVDAGSDESTRLGTLECVRVVCHLQAWEARV